MNQPRRIASYDVMTGLRELAEEKSGIYENVDPDVCSCVNKEEGENGEWVPSCIVGSFFVKILGVDINEMPQHMASNALVAQYAHQFTFTQEAKAILRAAQIMQDSRMITWEAIAETVFNVVISVESLMEISK